MGLLKDRAAFVKSATASGWQWLVAVAGHLGALALLLAAVGVSAFYTIKLSHFSYAIVVVLVAFLLLFVEGAYQQWKEAVTERDRAIARVAELEAPPAFPPNKIEFRPVQWADVNNPRGGMIRLLQFRLSVTNRDAQRILLRYRVSVAHGDFDMPLLKAFSYWDERISDPAPVEPLDHLTGTMTYEWTSFKLKDWIDFSPDHSFAPSSEGCFVLDLTDDATGTETQVMFPRQESGT
jgi:hypothetical protein